MGIGAACVYSAGITGYDCGRYTGTCGSECVRECRESNERGGVESNEISLCESNGSCVVSGMSSVAGTPAPVGASASESQPRVQRVECEECESNAGCAVSKMSEK